MLCASIWVFRAGTCNATFMANMDLRGTDLRWIDNVTDPTACCDLCVQEPKCVGFTVMGAKDKGTAWADRCYLKSHTAVQPQKFHTHTSGIVRPGVPPAPKPPGPSPAPAPGMMLTEFPVFADPIAATTTLNRTMGSMSWGPVMFFPGRWGVGHAAYTAGDVPIVLFEADVPHGAGAVLSTFDEHFTSSCWLSTAGIGCGIWHQRRGHVGPQGSLYLDCRRF